MTDARRGFALIVGATAVAGALGYLITLLVYSVTGAAEYATFAVFWATMYLIFSAISGLQQEVTRSTRRVADGTRSAKARNALKFATIISVGLAIVMLATSPLWADPIFPEEGWALVPPLVFAAASYVCVAVLAGTLFGLSTWRSLSLMIVVDPLLRILLLAIALATTQDVVLLAWMVALPVPLAVVLLWPFIRRSVIGHSELDVGLRQLGWNSIRVVGAAIATGVLVSGFPLLLEIASPGSPRSLIGELIFTISLARAPLIVSVIALQGFFIVQFRASPERSGALLAKLLGMIAAGGLVIAILGWWLGPAAFDLVSSNPVTIDGGFIALLVASSAVVAALAASGAALLARSHHGAYSIGWVVAALATILLMALPIDLLVRVPIALIVAPVLGLVGHLIALARLPLEVRVDAADEGTVEP